MTYISDGMPLHYSDLPLHIASLYQSVNVQESFALVQLAFLCQSLSLPLFFGIYADGFVPIQALFLIVLIESLPH